MRLTKGLDESGFREAEGWEPNQRGSRGQCEVRGGEGLQDGFRLHWEARKSQRDVQKGGVSFLFKDAIGQSNTPIE